MEEFIFRARVAECAERYSEMFEVVRELAEYKNRPDPSNPNLFEEYSTEERIMVSSCFKNLVGERQASLRTVALACQAPRYERIRERFEVYHLKLQWEVQAEC